MRLSYNAGKILVLGNCELSARTIETVLRTYGILKKDINFVSYNEINKFDFSQLLNTEKYCDIFIGPTPHKATSLSESTSPYQFLADHEFEVPTFQQLRKKNGQLAITKVNFENALLHSTKFRKETEWEFQEDILS
ncbi:hypothetical protein [Enterococcus sp. HY326]|uniref:hypothetical protein n=1 Tax=Enterococcus sp. HY326 TaxID=2971265 RepID=UPI00223EA177|nr:hypothetical protein [Enterococcus sp. HY326]